MGFLHKLWDETLAGPAPESGLSKLRKFNSFSAASHQQYSSSHHQQHDDDHFPVSRSITILRTNSNSAAALPNLNVSTESGSVPSSPSSSSTTPASPFSPTTPRGNFKKLTRRKSTSEALQRREPRSPTGYDWIVLSALDR